MKNLIRWRAPFPLYPIIISLFPVLYLYLNNIKQVPEDVILPSLVISLIFGALVYLLIYLVLKNQYLAAPLSWAFLVIFFSYNRLYNQIKDFQIEPFNFFIGPNKILIPLFILFFVVFTVLLFKKKKYLPTVNKILNVFTVILVLINLASIVSYEVQSKRLSLYFKNYHRASLNPISFNKTDSPDIYYLIFDRYSGEKTLSSYDYDNSPFLDYLESKNFVVAPESTSNYPATIFSLASTLNMEYLDFMTTETAERSFSDEAVLTPLIRNNKVASTLKAHGYRFINLGSWWEPSRKSGLADEDFSELYGYLLPNDFLKNFIESSVPNLIPRPTFLKNEGIVNWHLTKISKLKEIPKEKGPKFVFSHHILPHPPYVFDQDCGVLDEHSPKIKNRRDRYLNQLTCTNQKIKEIVDSILANSEKPPVIIIQADEGTLPIKYPLAEGARWADASNETLTEKFNILNAMYLPNLETNPVYPSITSVNTFRLIFNSYFGTNMELLPDKNFVFPQTDENIYKFTDVTDRLGVKSK